MEDLFFSSILLDWYDQNKRDLPWRQSQDPYIIWMSEIILQQTRVSQGLPYYERFIERFPDVVSLAKAKEDEIFKLWQGLGYYNRARNLHYAAKQIVENFNGDFPDKYEDVIALKGVGKYTAAAIMSFGYNQPYAVVDGNGYRVLSRIFGVEEYIDTSAGKKTFQALADALLNKKEPGLYNQAIMDFGALQCVPVSPVCLKCPFSDRCYAHNNDEVGLLPRKKGKTSVKPRYFNYLDIRVKGKAFLKKRENKDIWRGLYEFPLIETNEEVTFDDLMQTEEYVDLLGNSRENILLETHTFKHVLSHQIIYAKFYRIDTDVFLNSIFDRIGEKSLHDYAIPKMIENYLDKLH